MVEPLTHQHQQLLRGLAIRSTGDEGCVARLMLIEISEKRPCLAKVQTPDLQCGVVPAPKSVRADGRIDSLFLFSPSRNFLRCGCLPRSKASILTAGDETFAVWRNC